jgi:dissimilatory sulfite reductase (desulfoviridin) alpha/beta subunit
MEVCILCSVCVVRCPENAWKPEVRGATILIGGTMGRLPRLGVPLKQCVTDEHELFRLIDALLAYYRANGAPKERLGHMMERMGQDRVMTEILAAANDPSPTSRSDPGMGNDGHAQQPQDTL